MRIRKEDTPMTLERAVEILENPNDYITGLYDVSTDVIGLADDELVEACKVGASFIRVWGQIARIVMNHDQEEA